MAIIDSVLRPFLAPNYLWFLALIPVVVILYLLKLRRTPVIISSTLLWMKSLQDLTANAPFQKLRKNLLLFLQILILLLVVGALARPFIRAEGMSGNNLCLLIDVSASMQTREGEKTRLDQAKERALEMVDSLRGGDKMMIVTFAESSDVLSELSDDRSKLRSTIRSIEAVDTDTKIRDAILVANSLRMNVPDLKVVVLSDGRISDLDDVAIRALDLTYVGVGETSDNAGIVAFSIREPEEGKGRREAFLLVHNEDKKPLAATLTLSYNDSPLSVEEIEVPAGENRELVFALPELGKGVLRAELDHEDDFDVDNRAWLAVRPKTFIKILLVAEGDSASTYFLKRVFLLDPRVELSVVAPKDFVPTADYDLSVFDGFAPAELPAGSLLFINALPPIDGLAADGVIEKPAVTSKDSGHPLMRFLSPEAVGIQKAIKMVLPPGARSLLSTTGGPLLADVSTGGQRIVVIGFDLSESDWTLHLSFPLFIQNLLAWAPRAGSEEETSVPAGRPLTIMPVPDIDHAAITLPDGTERSLPLDPIRPTYYGDTKRAGIYTVKRGEDAVSYTVNLLDRLESSIIPASALAVGRAEIRAERGRVKQNREFWRSLIVLALVILSFEWWIYSRRAWF